MALSKNCMITFTHSKAFLFDKATNDCHLSDHKYALEGSTEYGSGTKTWYDLSIDDIGVPAVPILE